MNAVEIEEAISALAEQPFDADEFPFAFLEAFGNKQTTIKRLRSGTSNKSDIGGFLQTGNIHIKVAEDGAVVETLAALKASPATVRARAKFVLVTDGRELEECRDLVAPLDHQGLLKRESALAIPKPEDMDDDALLAELGVEIGTAPITQLTHVRSSAQKKSAEDIARRDKCEDFETFKPLFEQVQKELDSGIRETRPFELKAEIQTGRFFIVGGQKAYVASMGEITLTDHGRTDSRLRVIFDNGTESNMLMRSLQRSLNADDAGRRITEPTAGPLFSDQTIDGDEASGTIYVLRSKSDHPLVAKNRDLVHKIGVTNMSVGKRIAGAQLQPTFLMAKVEIVATYDLYNINRTKLENLVHRIFEPAKLDIEIMDRFGRPVVPREWFLVV